MTCHDASTRFGDRAHFPSMGSQLPKHIPGRKGIFLLEENQANPYRNRRFRGKWNSRYQKVGTAQFRMRIFLWGNLFGLFSFAKEKSVGESKLFTRSSQRYTVPSWLQFSWNISHWNFRLTKLAVGFSPIWFSSQFCWWGSGGATILGRWCLGDHQGSRRVFPRKFRRFLSFFWGFRFRIFQTREVNYFGYVWLKKKVARNPFGWNYVESWNEFERLAGMKQSPALEDSVPFWVAHVLQFLESLTVYVSNL